MAKRIKPAIDYEGLAGVVTDILPPQGLSRAVRIEFACRKCHLLAETRWTKFLNGKVQSCGCLSKEKFNEYHTTKARAIEKRERVQIFDHVERSGASSAATAFGISKYLAMYVWMRQEAALKKLPRGAAIAKLALASGNLKGVAKEHNLSDWDLKRLILIEMHRRVAVSNPGLDKEVQDEIDEVFRLQRPHSELYVALMEARSVLWDAERIQRELKFGDRWDDWRHAGEYSKRELNRKSKLWKLYTKLIDTDFKTLPTHLRRTAEDFCSEVLFTMRNRRKRQKDFANPVMANKRHEAQTLSLQLHEKYPFVPPEA